MNTLTTFLMVILSYMIADIAMANYDLKNKSEADISASINQFIIEENSHTFYGLASYYNTTRYFLIGSDSMEKIEPGNNIVLTSEEWVAVVSRLNVLAIKAPGLEVSLRDGKLIFGSNNFSPEITMEKISKSALSWASSDLDQIRYNHLWKPLAYLSKGIEHALVLIQKNIVGSWGWAVIVFVSLLKLLLLPVGVMTVKFQRTVSQIQSKLAPQLADIKATSNGEEAHNRIMAAHKELGVSPFYALKPLLSSFIQIPILIAVFNALGEMPQFNHQPFFWIDNLAYPDVIGNFCITLIMFGNSISILPFLMMLITLYSTIIFKNPHAPKLELKRQKRNLYLMAATFFILFYPFPAVMVLYWVFANVLQMLQQQLIKV